MLARDWLEAVQRQLLESGAPAGYGARLMAELRDHLQDISGEERSLTMSVEALQNELWESRLGAPSEVVAAVERQVGTVHFACRHPMLTYLLLPIPALLLLWTGYIAGLAGIFSLCGQYRSAPWAVQAAGILAHGVAYVPAIVLALLLSRVAMRSGTRTAWWLAGAAMIAATSALVIVSLTMPTTPGTGALQVGLSIPPHWSQWPQAAVPLAVTLAAMGYGIRKRRREWSPSAA